MKRAKFIHILIMSIILFLAIENSDSIVHFFNNAEAHLSQFSEISSNGFLVNEEELSNLEDSGITGSEYTFDTKFYLYFDMLSIEGQLLYKQVYANIKERKEKFVPTLNITTDEVQRVMEAVYNDHPEFFWVNTIYSYKYVENNIVVQITLEFNDTIKNFDSSKKKFDTIANRIIREANKLDNNYEKELYVHDEILKIASYNLKTNFNQSAYSALVNGQTVCAGYARAFQYIMIELGIPTYYVSGYSTQDHAWNIIFLDGEYYNVDLTWNNSNKNHQYFNIADKDIAITHKRKKLSVNLPKCNGTYYKYSNQDLSNDSNSNEMNNINTNNNLEESIEETSSCLESECYQSNDTQEIDYPDNYNSN